MTLIEKMARGLSVANDMEPDRVITATGMLQWQAFADDARAALQAAREPSEAMIHKGRFALECETSFTPEQGVERCWYAMIDAALSEQPQ